jgi:hypothetical protein
MDGEWLSNLWLFHFNAGYWEALLRECGWAALVGLSLSGPVAFSEWMEKIYRRPLSCREVMSPIKDNIIYFICGLLIIYDLYSAAWAERGIPYFLSVVIFWFVTSYVLVLTGEGVWPIVSLKKAWNCIFGWKAWWKRVKH